jgi:hypothetical protein
MIEVNLLAVLLASIASMVIGFWWYSPMWLGKVWMKERKLTAASMKAAQKEMGMLYGLSFIVSLVTAYVLAHVMALSANFYHYPMIMTGLTSGIWMWLGFVLPVQTTASIFGDKNWRLLGIDTGYQLASIIAMGAVIGWLS